MTNTDILTYPAEDTLRGYHRLRTEGDLDPLIEKIGDARYVLLGEASHGTHEYYVWRTSISKKLIREKGFSFIAVEGDWPDCYQINRFVKGYPDAGPTAVDVLKTFRRWPAWMWANWEISALAEWMRDYNLDKPEAQKVGFYGLDVYSLWESLEVIINYLRKQDPEVAALAINTLRCFEPYQEEGEEYARAVSQVAASCTDEVIQLLKEIGRASEMYDGDREAPLNAEMNALVIANAEEYYRSMVSFRDDSWNLRDAHMVSALDRLMKFHGPEAKAIVWEHNTHIGDARATSMRHRGLWNVGQLVREQQESDDVFIAGFSSYKGSVIAGRSWGATMEEMVVPPAMPGSVEYMLHNDSAENKLVMLDNVHTKDRFSKWLGHRAIGVVYRPEYEKGNYVPTLLPSRYDALLYIDRTKALHPIHELWHTHQTPETYPFGL